MTSASPSIKVAVLDDYQAVALSVADWSKVRDGPALRSSAITSRMRVRLPNAWRRLTLCVMRERTPLTASLLKRLPKLKLVASTGPSNALIDLAETAARGITVTHTGYTSAPTIELTWALILAGARHIAAEAASVRSGGWQRSVGDDMAGKTLGLLGLGHVGSGVAKVGIAFGMRVIAWSENLTSNVAEAVGARLVSKEEPFRTADVVSIHLVLSGRTVGLIGAKNLRR